VKIGSKVGVKSAFMAADENGCVFAALNKLSKCGIISTKLFNSFLISLRLLESQKQSQIFMEKYLSTIFDEIECQQ
jgi:hypothetical protein